MPDFDTGIGVILLAAGRSKRFGSNKLMIDFRGKELWEWSARAIEAAGFESRYLIVRSDSPIPTREGWNRIENPMAERGMGSSISVGIEAAKHHDRVVIALADMPFLETSHLRLLASGTGQIFTRYTDDGVGCPAAFDRESFDKLARLEGDHGAKVLHDPDSRTISPTSSQTLFDIDTEHDLAAMEEVSCRYIDANSGAAIPGIVAPPCNYK